MKNFTKFSLIICGLLLLAAFPAFGQNDEPVRNVQINLKPINDLAAYVLERVENDKVDLSQPFKVVLEGVLVKRLVKTDTNDFEIVALNPTKSKWTVIENEEAGNAEVGKIAKIAVEAYSDTGFLQYLYNFGITQFRLTFYQDDSKVVLSLESEQETAERARVLASGINGFLTVARLMVEGQDERALLNSFRSPFARDKVLFLTCELPKQTVQELINRNLAFYKFRKLSEQK